MLRPVGELELLAADDRGVVFRCLDLLAQAIEDAVAGRPWRPSAGGGTDRPGDVVVPPLAGSGLRVKVPVAGQPLPVVRQDVLDGARSGLVGPDVEDDLHWRLP